MAGNTARAAKPTRKALPLKLPSDVALDLQAFCEAHYGAPQNGVIIRAVEAFVAKELEADPAARGRFRTAKERLLEERSSRRPLRLVDPSKP